MIKLYVIRLHKEDQVFTVNETILTDEHLHDNDIVDNKDIISIVCTDKENIDKYKLKILNKHIRRMQGKFNQLKDMKKCLSNNLI